MHRHVRRVGDQRPSCVEHRAGEVEPLLDVHRIGGVLQRDAHLLGDRHEQVVEHLQHHRVGFGADRNMPPWRGGRVPHRSPTYGVSLNEQLGGAVPVLIRRADHAIAVIPFLLLNIGSWAAGEVDQRPWHRGSRERGGHLGHGVPGEPGGEQPGDGGPVGIQVTAGGEVRLHQALKESEGPREPGCPREIGELKPGEHRYHDPFAVGGSKVTGEAAVRAAADAARTRPGGAAGTAGGGAGGGLRRPRQDVPVMADARRVLRTLLVIFIAIVISRADLSLADDAEGETRGAAVLHQPGDLMPVGAVGVGLGQRLGNAKALECDTRQCAQPTRLGRGRHRGQ